MAKKKEVSKALEWNYSPSPESTSHVELKKRYELFIDGKWVKPSSGKYFATINPANEELLAEVAHADSSDVDKAVKAARKAFKEVWAVMPASERGKYIYRIARKMQERARELAVIETLDAGKTIRESPWNFPLLMAAWKIAPALAAGNTVVLKPAETTPLTALILAEIIEESGLPAGVVNIVTGHGDTGAEIVNHSDIDKIAFTGSTGVGKIIQKALAGTNKKLTLELGGKSANIIFDDAPIDQAVEGIVNGIFFNQGHVCCAGSRLFVQENVADRVIAKLKQRMESLYVGDPLDKNTDIGAINSKEQLDTITKYIKIGKEEGAEMYQPKCSIPSKGYYCRPTLFTNVAQSHVIAQEEIFGPVLTIQTFRTVDEVIQKANNSPYGLAAGIWTDKGSRIFNLSAKIRAGVVWANTYVACTV